MTCFQEWAPQGLLQNGGQPLTEKKVKRLFPKDAGLSSFFHLPLPFRLSSPVSSHSNPSPSLSPSPIPPARPTKTKPFSTASRIAKPSRPRLHFHQRRQSLHPILRLATYHPFLPLLVVDIVAHRCSRWDSRKSSHPCAARLRCVAVAPRLVGRWLNFSPPISRAHRINPIQCLSSIPSRLLSSNHQYRPRLLDLEFPAA